MKAVMVYSSEDAQLIEQIGRALHTLGMWVEQWPLRATDSLVSRVHEHLSGTDRLVIGLSPMSVLARWLRQEVAGGTLIELAAASALNDDFLIPVLLRPCEVPIWLRDRVRANFANKSFDAACQQLYENLMGASSACANGHSTNRVFRTWNVSPLGEGRHAMIMEFGVTMRRAQGLHIEVDVGAPYTATKDWFGPPNTPRVPSRPGGPFFNSSLRRKPPIYTRRFGEPEVTPTQSYYLYVEANEPLRVTERLCVDAYGREL